MQWGYFRHDAGDRLADWTVVFGLQLQLADLPAVICFYNPVGLWIDGEY